VIGLRARVLRRLVVLIACGVAAIEGGCRSGAEIDSPDLNVRRAPLVPTDSLPQPGTVRASLPEGAGMDAVRSGCVGCHEPAMLRQQRLTAQQWLVEIEKMQGWGAPVSNEDKTLMAGYLVGIAAPGNTRFTPAIVAPLSAERSGRNAAGQR
jgi:hypothetical protein